LEGWKVGRLGSWEVGKLGSWEVGKLGSWEVGRTRINLQNKYMSSTDTQSTVRKIFKDYLEKNHQRKTEERFNILDEIYTFEEHFDVESLYTQMKKKGFTISRATLYNTIELLLDCSLIKRHQFGKNLSRFERSYSYRQHDHLICEDCEHVFEFCDPRIQQIQSVMGDILKFNVTSHSLNLYGKCRELGEKGDCKYRKTVETL
jgi:Fur family ferric uptake transcriptional regulator